MPTSGEGEWRHEADQLAPEAFIREGSEFMDHWEVQMESPEDTARAAACGEGCSLVVLPGSPGAQVPVP